MESKGKIRKDSGDDDDSGNDEDGDAYGTHIFAMYVCAHTYVCMYVCSICVQYLCLYVCMHVCPSISSLFINNIFTEHNI